MEVPKAGDRKTASILFGRGGARQEFHALKGSQASCDLDGFIHLKHDFLEDFAIVTGLVVQGMVFFLYFQVQFGSSLGSDSGKMFVRDRVNDIHLENVIKMKAQAVKKGASS
jgi:hypothetical protein